MMTGTAIVSLIVISGYLMLNWQALQSHGLSRQSKFKFAAAWVAIFAIAAFLFGRIAG